MKLKIFLKSAALGLVLTTLVSGCAKKLDLAPYNAFTDESVFTTPERALLALNGVYDAAQSGNYFGAVRGYPFGAANIEQGDCRGEDMVNIAAFYQITYQATYNPTTANNNGHFINLYLMINKANVAIEGFQNAGTSGIISPALATQYEAECRFLRALAHHELAVHFCRPYLDGNGDKLGVPYRDFAVNSSEKVELVRQTARPTVAEMYTKMLADLDFAEANLPATNGVIRADKVAAIAMKMKLRLHMGQWAQVITEGNKLIPAVVNPLSPSSVVSVIGARSLTAQPNGSFTANSLSAENIFSIKNDALDNPGVNGALAAMYGSNSFGGRGLVSISPIIWNRADWLSGDTRRSQLATLALNANSTQSMMTTKYTDYVNRGDNNPILRFAEVLLMQAEAECRQAGAVVSPRAVDLLNVVRNRSIPTPAANQYTVASFATSTELLEAILLERRIEFLAEGKRWFDIHRTAVDPVAAVRPGGIPAKLINGSGGAALFGIGVPVTTGQAAIPYADFRFIWPIPVDEITSNPIITQNPGY